MIPKILIITPGFYPAITYGGPVTSIYNLITNLSNKFEFYIVTSNHELKDDKPILNINTGWNDIRIARILYLYDSEMTINKFDEIIKNIKPICIYLNAPYHLKTTPKLLFLGNKYKIRTIVATRGGLNPNALAYKKIIKKIYLKFLSFLLNKNTIFQSTSNDETKSIKKLFPNVKVHEIPNMPKQINFDKIPQKQYKLSGNIRIIYVSRILPIKNLLFALKAISKVQANVIFDIWGPIESNEYWNSCKSFITTKVPSNIQVHYKGYLYRDKINEIYKSYDLFILPTLSENFGHSIAEALYEKCPVLISDNTPWNDVNDFGVGHSESLNNIQGFINYIEKIAKMSEEELRSINNKIPDYINNHFNYDFLKSEYIKLFIG